MSKKCAARIHFWSHERNVETWTGWQALRSIEDQLTRAGSEADDILALTTTREGATNLRNYFTIAGKKANAETAVKVAGATAKHCIVIHGIQPSSVAKDAT